MTIVGLTGGIGSGKSTVSAALADRGAIIVDADAIVHDLQRPGTDVFAAIVDRFGDQVVAADGSLDRPAVAALVFGDGEEAAANRADLNSIVHPAVGARILEMMEAAEPDDVVILDVPLMVESGRGNYEALVVVDCPTDVALERVVRHRGMDPEDVRRRMEAQVSRAERLDMADFVIDNSGDLDALAAQIDRLWTWIGDLT